MSRRLFMERGYGPTTVAAIADAAGVSIETIYLSIGTKPSIVRYLVETALSGTDEPVPPDQRKGVDVIRRQRDPRERVRLFARLARSTQERLAPIWQVVQEAMPYDTDLAKLVGDLRTRHIASMALALKHLTAGTRLRKGLSAETARDVLWATNSAELYRLLVVERGWTGEMFEGWLADAWQRLLLD